MANSLPVFQDLVLCGSVLDRSRWRRTLVQYASAPWQHAEKQEREFSGHVGADADVLVFQREGGDGIAAAGLFLASHADGYEVTNIVPREKSSLDPGDYNAVLQDFVSRVVTPAANVNGLTMRTTAPVQSLDDWLSRDAADALRRFSGAANKMTGSAHPSDRKRWLEFLLKSHASAKRLDTGQLGRWLVEAEGWGDEQAHDLVVEYEFALELLRAHDRA